MGRLIAILILLLPLIEIALFVVIGRAAGLWPTLLGVVLSSLLGLFVLRLQGMAVLGEFRGSMDRRALPGQAIADAMMVGLAGMLLLVPGYFTTAIGLVLLPPPVRGLIYRFLSRRIQVVTTQSSSVHRPANGNAGGVIDLDDGDWRER